MATAAFHAVRAGFRPGASSVNPVDDNERGRGDDQFAGSAPPPNSSGRGIVAQEDVRALPDGERHRQCALRAFLLDKVEDAVEVGDGGVKPDDGNAQASRPLSFAMRASSFAITSSCGIHLASEASARPTLFSTSARNQASCSAAR